jgi:cytochrome c oxidase subunit IV
MRERALKIVLVLVGLLFLAAIYPIAMFLLQPGHEESSLPMILSLYAHAAVMVVQSFRMTGERAHLLGGVAMFGVIGIVLIVLAPGRQSADEAATSRAWAA